MALIYHHLCLMHVGLC